MRTCQNTQCSVVISNAVHIAYFSHWENAITEDQRILHSSLPSSPPLSSLICKPHCTAPLSPSLSLLPLPYTYPLSFLPPLTLSRSRHSASPLTLSPIPTLIPLGEPGLREATGQAILNANYMAKRIEEVSTVQHSTYTPSNCNGLAVHLSK